jgi:hypothetical protein
MLIWESDLSTLLFDGHPGRHELLAALKQTGDGGRLEAYSTRHLKDLRRSAIGLATAIMEAERSVTLGFSETPTGLAC